MRHQHHLTDRALIALVVAFTVSCSPSARTPVDPPTVSESGTIAFHLVLSNQSFEVPRVRLVVAIDGTPVLDEDFHVESQHTWVSKEFFLRPGEHQLTVLAPDRGEQLDETFVLGEELWGSLSYWSSLGGQEPFTWQTSTEPFVFG